LHRNPNADKQIRCQTTAAALSNQAAVRKPAFIGYWFGAANSRTKRIGKASKNFKVF
jgi:hypothetical protein